MWVSTIFTLCNYSIKSLVNHSGTFPQLQKESSQERICSTPELLQHVILGATSYSVLSWFMYYVVCKYICHKSSFSVLLKCSYRPSLVYFMQFCGFFFLNRFYLVTNINLFLVIQVSKAFYSADPVIHCFM